MKLTAGYCYKLHERKGQGDWRTAEGGAWQPMLYTPKGDETHLGSRMIDGSECQVFDCGRRGIRAALTQNCKPGPGAA